MGDDLVPNYGGTDYFDVPEERQESEAHDLDVLSTGNPFLIEVDDWFTDQVAWSDHITNFDPTSGISIEAQYYAHKLLHDKLQEKQAEFADLAQSLRDNV